MSEHQAWERNWNLDRNNQAISSIIVLPEMSRNLCGCNILSNHEVSIFPLLHHSSLGNQNSVSFYQHSNTRAGDAALSGTNVPAEVGDSHLQDHQAVTNHPKSKWQLARTPFRVPKCMSLAAIPRNMAVVPDIIKCVQPSLLPAAMAQSSSKSCVEITRTKEAAGGSSWLHHIFPKNNLLDSCEEENLIWLQINISRGDGMWSQAERLSWIIYGSQWMDNFPKLITLQPELFLLLQEQQSTSGFASRAGKYWIAREIVSLMLRGLFILFWSIYQYNQEATLGKESLSLPDTALLWGFEDALLCRALQGGNFCLS